MGTNLAKLEKLASTPAPVDKGSFNKLARLPYGLTVLNVQNAMEQFVEFLGFINHQLHRRKLERLESMLMSANFSSLVGEFMKSTIPLYCKSLVSNQYHNGHPDLIPSNKFKNDSVQYAKQGVELKASRYMSGWQGHNPEEIWLMVFVFDSNRQRDKFAKTLPRPFRFVKVIGAQLTKADWAFSGRNATSRRTITASVTKSGFMKLEANWIYRKTR